MVHLCLRTDFVRGLLRLLLLILIEERLFQLVQTELARQVCIFHRLVGALLLQILLSWLLCRIMLLNQQ